jgi:phosphatidylinositol phospholipase C delta
MNPETIPRNQPSPLSAPRWVLKRAGALLTSNGQPAVKSLDAVLTQRGSGGQSNAWTGHSSEYPGIGSAPLVNSPLSSSMPTTPKLKLSASIKRRFSEVKASAGALGRSKSFSPGGGGGSDMSGRMEEKPEIGSRIGNSRTKWDPAGIHVRSASLSSTTRPPLHHTTSAPVRKSMDRLSSVAEASHGPDSNILATSPTSASFPDITVPMLLQQGTPMTKISNKKKKKIIFKLDPDLGQISWESKQRRISVYSILFPFIFPY